MERWRFLEVDWLTYAETGTYRPVLMKAISEGIVPNTVSFCTFTKPSVVTTFFADPEKEINLDLCKKKGIPARRLVIGGGPIFGDTGYIITFFHLARNNLVPQDIGKMCEKILIGVAAGLSKYFNVECRFRPINDVEIKCEDGAWRKIGPSGYSYGEKVIQITTGMQVKENDVDLVSSLITPAKEKFQDKQAKSIQQRITYLEKVVCRSIDFGELKTLYTDVIEKLFDVELVPGELTQKEKSYYQEMEKEYAADEFFMDRSERKFGIIPSGVVRKTIQFKVPEGPFMRIITLIMGDKLLDILISGTIFASPLIPTSPIHEIEKALKNQPVDEKLFEQKVEEIMNRPDFSIQKVSNKFLANKIFECATQ